MIVDVCSELHCNSPLPTSVVLFILIHEDAPGGGEEVSKAHLGYAIARLASRRTELWSDVVRLAKGVESTIKILSAVV
jgi:hypothetical protein